MTNSRLHWCLYYFGFVLCFAALTEQFLFAVIDDVPRVMWAFATLVVTIWWTFQMKEWATAYENADRIQKAMLKCLQEQFRD